MNLAESELILNDDGSIYHLHLTRDMLAETVFLVGDPARVTQISKYFDEIEVNIQNREFVTHTGRLGSKRFSVVSTGIGTHNIDIVLNELDAVANIDFITRKPEAITHPLVFIRIGTSGSVQKSIPPDSFIVSSGAFGIDGLLNFYERRASPAYTSMEKSFQQHFTPPLPSRPYYSEADGVLLKDLATGLPTGITVTCPGFYAPQGRMLRIASVYPEFTKQVASFSHEEKVIENLEMETAAIYGLSELLGHRAISFSAILANRITAEFSKTPKETVEKLIRFVLEKAESNL